MRILSCSHNVLLIGLGILCRGYFLPSIYHLQHTYNGISYLRPTSAFEVLYHWLQSRSYRDSYRGLGLNAVSMHRHIDASDHLEAAYTSKKRSSPKKFINHKDKLDKVLIAIRGLNDADSLSTTPTLTDLNHAITTAGRLGRIEDAMEIFNSIKKVGYSPDLMSYNNVIWCAGNAKRTEISRKIFNQLSDSAHLKANVYTYGALMHGFAKTKNYKQALALIDEMTRKGIKANQIVISSAMEACAESGQYKEALELLDRIVALGLKPDVTMINTAIKACSIAGAMDEAESLAETLRQFGSMDLFTYHTLMMGNTKLGRYQRVLNLYSEAQDSSAKLDGGIYSLAMLAALNAKLHFQVPQIADKARSLGIRLTEASYTTLIQVSIVLRLCLMGNVVVEGETDCCLLLLSL